MVGFGHRLTIVVNQLDGEEAELRINIFPLDGFQKTIRVESGAHVEVGATDFIFDDNNPHRYATVKLFVAGSDTEKFLMPRDFLTYGKIIITRNQDGNIRIVGIKARFSDFGRIKYVMHLLSKYLFVYVGNRY